MSPKGPSQAKGRPLDQAHRKNKIPRAGLALPREPKLSRESGILMSSSTAACGVSKNAFNNPTSFAFDFMVNSYQRSGRRSAKRQCGNAGPGCGQHSGGWPPSGK
jgi:hypothetical protein